MRVFTIFLLLLLSNNIFSQKVNILKESKKLYKKGNFQEALTSIEIIEKNSVIINTKHNNNKNYLYKKIVNPYAIKKNAIKEILNKSIFKAYLHNLKFIEDLSISEQKKITSQIEIERNIKFKNSHSFSEKLKSQSNRISIIGEIKKAVLEAHKFGEIGGYGGKMSHYMEVKDSDYNVLREVIELLNKNKS